MRFFYTKAFYIANGLCIHDTGYIVLIVCILKYDTVVIVSMLKHDKGCILNHDIVLIICILKFDAVLTVCTMKCDSGCIGTYNCIIA